MSWVLYSFLSLLTTVLYGLISKKTLSNHKTNIHPIAFASATFVLIGFITFFAYLLTSGFLSSDIKSFGDTQTLKLLGLNFILYTIAPSFYYRSMKELPLSIVTIIYSLSGFLALLIESILGLNSFNLVSIFGSALIIFSIGMVSFKVKGLRYSKYFLYMFLATLFYSLCAILDNQLVAKFSDNLYLSLVFGIPGLLIIPINLLSWSEVIKPYQKRNYWTVVLFSFFLWLSFYLVFAAYASGGSAGQVYSVIALDAVLTVIFSAIFLGERAQFTMKVLAAIIAGAGVYLLNI